MFHQFTGTLSPDLVAGLNRNLQMIFSEEIYPLFKDEDFKDYYSDKGRNGISPAFLSGVTLLQFKEDLSDTEAREA